MQTERSDDVFGIPLWGRAAERTPPGWLVDALLDGSLELNSLGGLTSHDESGMRSCIAGDFVVRRADGTISFLDRAAFEEAPIDG